MKSTSIHWPQVYLCVFLTTLATLLLELSLTRIFSVVFYYHLAFLAISIALFGLGIGGVFSYLVAGWKAPLFSKLGRLSALNSFLVLLALGVILLQGNGLTNWDLALIYLTTSFPFFVSGAIVSLAISETMERVNRVYLFDLLGASGGCLLLVPLLSWFGGPNTVIAAAVFFAVAAAVWHSMAGSVMGRAGSVALALALVALLTYNRQHPVIDVTHSKGQTLASCANMPDAEKIHGCELWTRWNTFSRIALVDHTKKDGRYDIVIDGDAATSVFGFNLDRLSQGEQRELRDHGEYLPYILRPGAKTLVIGPGGGWDVARALASGSHDITAVEINPIIATTIMREKYQDLSHRLYWRPGVQVHEEDGRSFVRRSSDKYQVLQATLVDTWAATAAGAFALSESNLYTTDAFRDYLSHLTDDGLIAMTRWGLEPPRESLRLIALAIEALGQLGESDPAAHIIVGREGDLVGWRRDTVLIGRKPFSAEDVARARTLMETAHMTPVYLPGAGIQNRFYDLLQSSNPEEYERHYTYDISPVTDNRPFFFYSVQPRDLWKFLGSGARNTADYKILSAVPLLFALMGVSLFATAVILVAPPLVLGTRLPRQRGVRGFLLYFLFVGAGYILIEVGLIQKFVLFLGHPVYALAVVIFSMLVSSGLGSYWSRRLVGKDEGRLIKALGVVALLAASLALILSWLLTALVWLPLALKAALTVALIAPLGFAMGMPFPTALARLEEWHAPSVRWAWSLNAASSVLGSVGALVCAIYLGLVQTLIIGGIFYLAALAVVARVRPAGDAPAAPVGPGRVVLAK